jgi:hypothetical protein
MTPSTGQKFTCNIYSARYWRPANLVLFYTITAANAYGPGPASTEIAVVVPYPTLTASPVSGRVRLIWGGAASQLRLQSTTNLKTPVTWSALTNIPTVQNGSSQLDWFPADATRFFRLSP